MSEKIRKLAATIAALKGVEAKHLRDEMEEVHGIKDERPETLVIGDVIESKPLEEKTEFDVVLISIGENKMNVIKTVKNIFGYGLKEAKDLVDDCVRDGSVVLSEALPKISAEMFKQQLEKIGAVIELK